MVELLLQNGANPQQKGKGKENAISLTKGMKDFRELISNYDKKEKKERASTFDVPERTPIKSNCSNRKHTLDSNKSKESMEEDPEQELNEMSDDDLDFGIPDISNPKDQRKVIQETAVEFNELS